MCWSHSPTKRPTAREIVELLYNNPRLLSPSIEVPLASVQMERGECLHISPSHTPVQYKTNLNIGTGKENSRDDPGYDSEAYSPMLGHIHQNTDQAYPPHNQLMGEGDKESDGDVHSSLLCTTEDIYLSSYVPPGYILIDHSDRSSEHRSSRYRVSL